MSKAKIKYDRKQLAEYCRTHHITRLAFFGSVLREDFALDSDIDILVEFEPGKAPGWELVGMVDDFSKMFGGRKVDLLTYRGLKNERLRELVMRELEVQYEQKTA